MKDHRRESAKGKAGHGDGDRKGSAEVEARRWNGDRKGAAKGEARHGDGDRKKDRRPGSGEGWDTPMDRKRDPAGKKTGNIGQRARAGKRVETQPGTGRPPVLTCPVAKKCGGCQLLAVPYEEQLARKRREAERLLKPYCPVRGIAGMEDPLHYRNKVCAAFAYRRDGSIVSGTYQEGTHHVAMVDECLLEDRRADAIIRDIRSLLRSFKIQLYNEDSGHGLLRHVLIRTAHATGEILVVLVLRSPVFPSKNHFVKALRGLHPEITTIVLNVNDKNTNMVLGEKETVLYGKGYIEDELCGRRFRLSPRSFYQVNSLQAEALYEKAIELAALAGRERVIDAYCGIGTIGLIAARTAGEVIGVELNPDAVRDAIRSAKQNGVRNIRFFQGDAGDFLSRMAEDGEHCDVVFLDPPRAGSSEAFLSSLAKLSPRRVVYISCCPETIARDLKFLTRRGYRAEDAWVYDMFPFCEHVETVCLLNNRKPDTKVKIDVDFTDYYRIKDAKKNQN